MIKSFPRLKFIKSIEIWLLRIFLLKAGQIAAEMPTLRALIQLLTVKKRHILLLIWRTFPKTEKKSSLHASKSAKSMKSALNEGIRAWIRAYVISSFDWLFILLSSLIKTIVYNSSCWLECILWLLVQMNPSPCYVAFKMINSP